MKDYKTLRIIPLGGLGEVGKNMMVYEYGNECIIIDAGIMFPENDMLGVDYIIPDMQYLFNRGCKVLGLIITHGHEDHIGAIPHVLEKIQTPIYASPLTRGMIEAKLARHGGLGRQELHTIQPSEEIVLGPFRVEFFHVCHSVPDGLGLGIHTPAGLIVHMGDYKFDQTPVDGKPTDFSRLARFSEEGVLALLSDSTNAERSGWTPSEKVIDSAFDDIFRNAGGRIIIASFASLISRIQQVADAATRYGRKMAIVGTSMVDNAKIARKLGYLQIDDDVLVNLDQALKMPDSKVVLMCTGSQGEPTSVLGRLSMGRYRAFDVQEGDTVIFSSHPIPGNEEIIYRTINRLFQRGAEVVYEAVAPVHVSGHASQEEIKLLINLVRPEYLIPIHGELRHLRQHARLAIQVGIPPENVPVVENGQVIEFDHGHMRLAERVPGTYVFVDGSGVGEVGPGIMREREALAQEGVVTMHVVVDATSGKLLREPHISGLGFMLENEAQDVFTSARRLAGQAAANANGNLQKDLEKVLRDHIYGETRRRPVINVIISRI